MAFEQFVGAVILSPRRPWEHDNGESARVVMALILYKLYRCSQLKRYGAACDCPASPTIRPTSVLSTKAAPQYFLVTLLMMNTDFTNAASSSASASATQNASASNVKEGSARDRDAATLAEMGEAMLPLRQMFAKFNTDVGRQLRPESDMSPEDFRTTAMGELLKVAKLLKHGACSRCCLCSSGKQERRARWSGN